jgi:rhodanese-related sulfurtransferase
MDIVPNVSVEEAAKQLREDPMAEIVDVRTDAELMFVGYPDAQVLGKALHVIPWQLFPSMGVNPNFIDELLARGLTHERKLYFLCRSGVRSMAAGRAALAAGYQHAFNIADGFEGPVDRNGHRGTVAGWKAAGLPWMQR